MVRQPAERRACASTFPTLSRPPSLPLPSLPPPDHLCLRHHHRHHLHHTCRVITVRTTSALASAWQDIFLRELISNAADACDKKRFLSLTEEGGSFYEGRVRLVADKEANTLTIEDNGIGMTRADLKNNLGKIAQSGAPVVRRGPVAYL